MFEIKNPPIEELKIEDLDISSMLSFHKGIDITPLTESIKEIGLRYPIVVVQQETLETGKTHKVLSGFRRVEALKSLGYKTIPCYIIGA